MTARFIRDSNST